MKAILKLVVVTLCAVTFGAAQVSAATSGTSSGTGSGTSSETKNLPSGLTFNYDAIHDQINAAGLQLKPAALASPSVAPTTGTVTVTINIKIVSHFRNWTSYHCSLTVVGGEIDIVNGAIAGGMETANGIATPAGAGEAVCTLTIPYSWSIVPDPAAVNGLILAFGASAVDGRGNGNGSTVQVLRSTLQVDGVESLPANGSTSTFVFDVAL
jgi:hypothetical protein